MLSTDAFDTEVTVWSVSDFSQHIQKNLQQHVPLCWIVGEISGLYRAQSGHVYATLKDQQAQIKIVIYSSTRQKLGFELEEGLKVRLLGQATVYRPKGELQVVAKNLEPDGMGPLKLAFEQIKAKLQEQGLFAPEHKKSLPAFPHRLALITSADGAVYHDMLRVLMRRYPIAQVDLHACSVQGARAIPEILSALEQCAQQGTADLVIIARGGGSLEDLWAFNSEEVVRAVFDFPIPIISAIGHETDVTLCDFAADLRAATPSVAAELAVPTLAGIYERLAWMSQSWKERWKQLVEQYQQRLDYQERFLQQSSFLFDRLKIQIDNAEQRLRASMMSRLQQDCQALGHQQQVFSYLGRKMTQQIEQHKQNLMALFSRASLGVKAQEQRLHERLEHFTFRLNQLNPQHPDHVQLFNAEHGRLKSAAGISAGMQAELQFHDGSWIIEFIRKMPRAPDNDQSDG